MLRTAAIILLFIILFGIAGRMDKQDAQRAQVPQEDELFWDCTTSGNYHCGPEWPIAP